MKQLEWFEWENVLVKLLSNSLWDVRGTEFYRSVRETVHATKTYQSALLARIRMSYFMDQSKVDSDFDDVETLCMFVGHGRSGHSIIGALMDAHPDIILADETDVLKYLSAGFNRNQIFYALLQNSQREARQGRSRVGREGKKYNYWVEGQWQGRYKKLKVIGDTKAGVSARKFAANPALLPLLRKTIGIRIRFVQVTRNPFDSISTMLHFRGLENLDEAIDAYFGNCESLLRIYQEVDPEDVLTAPHEELISSPKDFVRKLNDFVGVESSEEYLEACASIVFTSPAKNRRKIQWDKETIEAIESRMKKYGFLAGYSYDD